MSFFQKKNNDNDIKLVKERKDYGINNNTLKPIIKEDWIEVYGYKGLSNEMVSTNIIEECIVPYTMKQTYRLENENSIITGYRGFHLSSELVEVFEKYDPFQHNRYFKVRAIVKESEWNKLLTGRSLKNNIAAKEIELLEEVIIDYETIINRYDFHRENPECLVKNIFPTEEKWLKFYNDKTMNLHTFIINENFNILKNSKCMFSDSMIKIILQKIEDVTIARYRGFNDLNKNIIIYAYVKKIIDLRTIDNIPKEVILDLLCKNILF